MDKKIYETDDFITDESDLRHLEDPADEYGAGGESHSFEDLLPLYRVKTEHSSETECFTCPPGLDLVRGERVVIPTRYGKDLGIYLGPVYAPGPLRRDDIQSIIRRADEHDVARANENREREKQAFNICREKIAYHKLEMKLVSAHYLLDEPKVLFFFTADSRVDFRELVKDLVSVFKMRIELRQIGVRDESRVTGGIGVCGRCLCCHGLNDKLRPVSIKMAKEQNLSLNSMKISGPCGRLLCCLSYEYDFYHEEKSKLPSEGSRIYYDGSFFKIIEVNILSKVIRLSGEGGRMAEFPFCCFSRDPQNGKWKLSPERSCSCEEV